MWQAEPQVVIAISFFAILYVVAAVAMKRRPRPRQEIAYALAVLLSFASLTGPLDEYAKGYCFAAYIFQQMMLVFVIPPLVLLALPDWMLRPALTNRSIAPVVRVLTRPLFAFLIFSMFFALLHYPALCDKVCHARQFYGGIRAALVSVGLLMWWPMLSPLPEFPRLTYPLQILYLFLLMIPMTAVAAPITMSETVLYVYYNMGQHPFGLSPIADQVLGGLIMWIGQGVYIMFVFSAIFFRWAQRDDTEVPAINRKPARVHVLHSQERHAV
jgi:putative membrane protein